MKVCYVKASALLIKRDNDSFLMTCNIILDQLSFMQQKLDEKNRENKNHRCRRPSIWRRICPKSKK